jgi:phage tail-like protein
MTLYRVHLPSVTFDAIVSANITNAFITNRIPEVDEDDVLRTAPITFCVGDKSGAFSDAISVTVNGVPAYTGGTFQPGFNGGGSSAVLLDGAMKLYTIAPVTQLDSDADVVVAITVGSLFTQTYTFHTVDETAPFVDSARALARRTVRVTFSESVTDSALVAANYSFVHSGVFAVDVVAASVARVDGATVDVTADIDLTFAAEYTVNVYNVVDLAGNALLGAPNNTFTFNAFSPTVPDGRRFLLWDFVPRVNKRADNTRDLYKFISVCQEIVNVCIANIDAVADVNDPDTAPENVIDAMLDDMGNPFELDLTLADKRRLLGVLVAIYQLKGTAPGIEGTINFLTGITVRVIPSSSFSWTLGINVLGSGPDLRPSPPPAAPPAILGPGTPYQRRTFSIKVVSPTDPLTDDQRSRIEQITRYMKAASEHLSRVDDA